MVTLCSTYNPTIKYTWEIYGNHIGYTDKSYRSVYPQTYNNSHIFDGLRFPLMVSSIIQLFLYSFIYFYLAIPFFSALIIFSFDF